MRGDSRSDSRSSMPSGSTGQRRASAAGRSALRSRVAAGVIALALLTAAIPAQADRYDPKKAGFPLRIVAYIVHPIGVILDTLILRPAHWVGSKEPLKTLFGHTDD